MLGRCLCNFCTIAVDILVTDSKASKAVFIAFESAAKLKARNGSNVGVTIGSSLSSSVVATAGATARVRLRT